MPRTFVWHPGRGRAVTPKALPPTDGKLRIRQIKSGINQTWRMKAVLVSLGLRHHQSEVIKQDSPALRGAIKKVRHLVEVTAVEE
jgi:large subunit ribosomal protein L30